MDGQKTVFSTTEAEVHAAGLRGEVLMWTHDWVNYWWVGGKLWSCRDRTDEERFAGIANVRFEPWTEEDRRGAAFDIWMLRGVVAAALVLDGFVLWLGFGGAG